MKNPDDPLTCTEAAEVLGITPRTLRQHAQNGNVPAKAFGHTWIFRRADIEEFKKSKRPRGRPKAESEG